MTISVTNYGDCIFKKSDFNPGSIGYDTVDSCILLQKLTNKYNSIVAYDSYLEEEIPELNIRLNNCPLNNEEVIVKLNV